MSRNNNVKATSAIKQIINAEKTKRIFNNIKYALQKQRGPYMNSLMTPTDIENIQEMWNKLKIRRENPQ